MKTEPMTLSTAERARVLIAEVGAILQKETPLTAAFTCGHLLGVFGARAGYDSHTVKEFVESAYQQTFDEIVLSEGH